MPMPCNIEDGWKVWCGMKELINQMLFIDIITETNPSVDVWYLGQYVEQHISLRHTKTSAIINHNQWWRMLQSYWDMSCKFIYTRVPNVVE